MLPDNGYLKTDVNVGDAMQHLADYIEEIPGRYKKFSLEELLYKSAPNKWSKKEVLGHLIDSAINNLKRFTEIQFLPQPYIVQSYKQDELVAVNNYQNLPLEHLLKLWQSLNRQIIYIVNNFSAEKLALLANPQYDNDKMQTLGWIICDYVAHMEHHLQQIYKVRL